MKIVEAQNLVKIEGDVEVKKFGFLFNAKMVKLLSDSLYNDKILAIVRELSTNALDSHKENGCADKAFDVHLPTWNEMWFSIRDYGTGMSAERVDNIYRNYGGSDRTDSNEFTGGMGLGSKTPFCYHTKTFTIDVWYNDTHTCYSAYIGEDGIPEIAKMSEAPSTEPSGVQIKLPVKQYDERNFIYAAEKIYRYFPVKPNFYGATCNIKPLDYVVCGDNGDWKLRKHDNEGCRVVMGNVAYPVKFDDANITSAQRNVMNSPFDIYAEIGSISVDIGREGLSYDNRTKTRIRYYINEIVHDYNAKIQKEIAGCKNLWEARKKCAELMDAVEIKVADPLKLEYNGRKLFDTLNNTVGFESFIKSGQLTMLSFSKDSWKTTYEKRRINSVNVKQRLLFYENDLAIGAFVRCGAISQREGRTVVLFQFEDAAAKAAVLEHMGLDDTYFTKISSEPSPTTRTSGASRGNIGRVLSFDKNVSPAHCTKSTFWNTEQDVDFDEDSGVYVEFNRFNFRDKNGNLVGPQELSRVLRHCADAGLTVPTIFGIKTADIGKIKNNSDWVEFHVYMTDLVTKKLVGNNMEECEFFHNQLRRVGSRKSYRDPARLSVDAILAIRKHLIKDTLFKKFADKVEEAKRRSANYDQAYQLRSVCYLFGITPVKNFVQPKNFDLDNSQTLVYNTYSVLKCVSENEISNHGCYPSLAQYIDLIG